MNEIQNKEDVKEEGSGEEIPSEGSDATKETIYKESLTIEDLKNADLRFDDLFNIPLQMKQLLNFDWDNAIKFANAIIKSGEPITLQSTIGRLIKDFGMAFTKSFL